MARKRQTTIADVPHHVLFWAGYGQACFRCDEDFQVYLLALEAARRKHACEIHAYVLMADHVHLLVTPRMEQGLPALTHSVERRYQRYVSRQYKLAAPRWEIRYHCNPVIAGRGLLHSYQYIELYPVRAGLVHGPEAYRWSSHSHNAHGRFDSIVTPHGSYAALGGENEQRQNAYRRLFEPSTLTP